MYPFTRKPLPSTLGLPIPVWLVLKILRLAYKIHECLLPSAFFLLLHLYRTALCFPVKAFYNRFPLNSPLALGIFGGEEQKSFRIALRFYLP